jgi:putative membrane protein
MDMMLKGHKKVLKEFQDAKDLKDADVRSFALEAVPVIQKHLDSAMAITGKK